MLDTPEDGMRLDELIGTGEPPPASPRERRSSRRLPVRIPILLDWGGRREPGWTVTANEGGALVTCKQPVEAGQRVTVINVTTGRTAVARVVSPLLADAGRSSRPELGFRLALRLETFGVRFWGPVYYAACEGIEAD